jgi:hypothetical protein
MFGFQLGTMHTSKDNAYDDNNNVIRSIYQVLVTVKQGSKRTFDIEKNSIIGENFPKIS